MNKYQEALKRLRTNEYLTSREQREYYNLLQELVDKEKLIEKENQELKEQVINIGNKEQLMTAYYKDYKKAIEILKNKVTFRWRNDQILEIVKYPWAKKTTTIAIDKELKTYRCIIDELGSNLKIGDIGIQEHKLLSELFVIWEWYDND